MQSYTLLIAFKENLPGDSPESDIPEDIVIEYHEILNRLAGMKLDVSAYMIPEEKLQRFVRSMNYMTGRDKKYSEKRYCSRGFLLRKLDALLLCFRLKSEGKEPELIGFKPNEE